MEEQRQDNDKLFSKRVKAGRRTYFFDVRSTKRNDFYITITESKKRFDDQSFVKQKIFLYKEDFNKFLESLTETVNYVKSELLPEYDFDEFTHTNDSYNSNSESNNSSELPDDFESDFKNI